MVGYRVLRTALARQRFLTSCANVRWSRTVRRQLCKAQQLAARLHGSWQAETAPGRRVIESFRTISADSALVETFVTAGGRETASIYHADREALLMTHYCAQGNQPRLQLTSSSEDDYVFRFRDATNLLPEQSCLVEKRLHFVGDKLEQTEVYKASNGSTESTTLHFERHAPAN